MASSNMPIKLYRASSNISRSLIAKGELKLPLCSCHASITSCNANVRSYFSFTVVGYGFLSAIFIILPITLPYPAPLPEGIEESEPRGIQLHRAHRTELEFVNTAAFHCSNELC